MCSLNYSAFREHVFQDISLIMDLGHKVEVSKCSCSDLVNYTTQMHRYMYTNKYGLNLLKTLIIFSSLGQPRTTIRQSPSRH